MNAVIRKSLQIVRHEIKFARPHILKRAFSNHKIPDSAELHQSYQDQLKELQDERIELFGSDEESPPSSASETKNDIELTMEEMNQEREISYGFTKEEKNAWGGKSQNASLNKDFMHAVKEARKAKALYDKSLEEDVEEKSITFAKQSYRKYSKRRQESEIETVTQPFTHLNQSGDQVTMVDVGHKTVSRRVAVARSTVVFPPEVMDAFDITNGEMIGKKGPIFATARLAGIMGAKRTSDLIPLCHPLPLDAVNVDIILKGNRAHIECKCSVTHKTGVEMEALAGASIAALTIYDMVKAVSHRIKIEQTELVTKKGGKRKIENGKEI